MEEFILALISRGVKVGNLLSGEITIGNYLRKRLRGQPAMTYRRHPDIRMVDNLCVYRWPLRWSKNVTDARHTQILAKAQTAMARYIEEEGRPDLIFHHGIFDYTYLTRFLSTHFQIPYWYKEHSSYIEKGHLPCNNDFETPESLRAFVQGAEVRFAPSSAYCEKLAEAFDAPFEVLHNYLNDDYFKGELPQPTPAPFVFLNVAVMTPAKNQQLIIRAFAKAIENDAMDARLVIAGDGTLRAKLQELATELGVTQRVDILTFQSRSAIRALFDQSHAFVLSSQLETFGLVLVEAMARGLPVISSRIPGPLSLVRDANGLLFDPDDAADLAKALQRIYASYDQYDRESIRHSARAQFGPDHLIDTLTRHPRFPGHHMKDPEIPPT